MIPRSPNQHSSHLQQGLPLQERNSNSNSELKFVQNNLMTDQPFSLTEAIATLSESLRRVASCSETSDHPPYLCGRVVGRAFDLSKKHNQQHNIPTHLFEQASQHLALKCNPMGKQLYIGPKVMFETPRKSNKGRPGSTAPCRFRFMLREHAAHMLDSNHFYETQCISLG